MVCHFSFRFRYIIHRHVISNQPVRIRTATLLSGSAAFDYSFPLTTKYTTCYCVYQINKKKNVIAVSYLLMSGFQKSSDIINENTPHEAERTKKQKRKDEQNGLR